MTRRRPAKGAALSLPEDHPLSAEVRDALVRAQAQTLQDLYDGWQRLRLARAGAAAERAREAERLEQRADYVVGSIQTARALPGRPAEGGAPRKKGKALAAGGDAFEAALAKARSEVGAARAQLDLRTGDEERFFEGAVDDVRRRIAARARAMAEAVPPRLSAQAQPLGPDRVLLQLARPGPDEALLWSLVLAGALPTRYDAFFDDAVDDLSLPPARLYAEEGNPSPRPGGPDAEDAVALAGGRAFVPVKAMIALAVPGHPFPRFRVVNRGPVAEVEAREPGGPYENLLPRRTAELFTGYLLRLRVEGRIALELQLC